MLSSDAVVSSFLMAFQMRILSVTTFDFVDCASSVLNTASAISFSNKPKGSWNSSPVESSSVLTPNSLSQLTTQKVLPTRTPSSVPLLYVCSFVYTR